MKLVASLGLALAVCGAGCVEGLAPGEVGVGRRVGMYPGDVPAMLPPLTDELGNLYVVTGQPDSAGVPQPGVAHSGGARGGWSMGCETGTGREGGARGWLGAFAGRAWLWTGTAIVELDVATGTCATKLDTDPVSTNDVHIIAAAPLVDRTISGAFALAIITIGAEPTAHLVTIDLDLGLVRASEPLGSVEVLAVGADGEHGAFMIRDAAGARVLLAQPHRGTTATIAVTGTVPAAAPLGELAFGSDGSVVAIVGNVIAAGSRAGLAIAPAPFAARAFEHDNDGRLYLAGSDPSGPRVAPVASGTMGAMTTWTTARSVDASLAQGVIVVDERGGKRSATRWQAHGALGDFAALSPRSASHYAVGARALLIADPPVDRGGIPYSQLAVVPVGVELP